jgi:hypothetical protein
MPYKLGNMQSQISENEKEIKLTVEDLGKTKAELVIQSTKISAVVEEGPEVGSWNYLKMQWLLHLMVQQTTKQ